MSYNPDLRKWTERPLQSNACESERRSHASTREFLASHRIDGLTLSRGGFRLPRATMYLLAACLYGLGFLSATWITAILRT